MPMQGRQHTWEGMQGKALLIADKARQKHWKHGLTGSRKRSMQLPHNLCIAIEILLHMVQMLVHLVVCTDVLHNVCVSVLS